MHLEGATNHGSECQESKSGTAGEGQTCEDKTQAMESKRGEKSQHSRRSACFTAFPQQFHFHGQGEGS